MILSLGLGEVAFIPDAHLGLASDDIDLTLVPFLQLYALEEVPWEVLASICSADGWCLLAHLLPEDPFGVGRTAEQLQRVVRLGVVEEQITSLGPRYRLAPGPLLRKLAGYLRAAPIH
jgi:hypothetical protein